jgi:hypothetical protein
MTDWHDIVDMINTFSKVFHLRQSPRKAAATYPPVPTVINPSGVKRVSATTSSASSEAGQVEGEGAEQTAAGYTGELGASSEPSQNGERPVAFAPLQWRDIWPEL